MATFTTHCHELDLTLLEVDPATVATDSFMTNVHLVLLHFAEPFMDAQYSKVSVEACI
jgi:hypothetical protein